MFFKRILPIFLIILASLWLVRSNLKRTKSTPTVDKIIQQKKSLVKLTDDKKKEYSDVKTFIDESIVEDLSKWKKYNLLCKEELEEEMQYRGFSLSMAPDDQDRIETLLQIIHNHQKQQRVKTSYNTIEVVEKTLKLLESKKITLSFAQSIFAFIEKYNDCFYEESYSLHQDILEIQEFKLSPVLSIEINLELSLLISFNYLYAFNERSYAIRKLLLNPTLKETKREQLENLLVLINENNHLLFNLKNESQIKNYRKVEKEIKSLADNILSPNSKKIRENEKVSRNNTRNTKDNKKVLKIDKEDDESLEDAIAKMKTDWDQLPEEEKSTIKLGLSTLLEGLILDRDELKHEMYNTPPSDERYMFLQASKELRDVLGDLKENVIQFLSADDFSEDDIYTLAIAMKENAPKLSKEKDANQDLNEAEKLVIEELTSELE